ncbi:MAG: quinoprotein dehydrogenase-associated putative ABC transporter substrate-binding protein [Sphingomonas sp.]
MPGRLRLAARAGLIAALSLLTSVALPGGALAQDEAEAVDRTMLRVCADPSSPPQSSEDGKGFENRIADLLAADLAVPVRYIWFPNSIGFFRRTLNARRCDVVIGTAQDNDIALTTAAYYRSTYVLVTRTADHVAATSLEDPALQPLIIGVQARTPAADIFARLGLLDHMRSYDLVVDTRIDHIGQRLIDDVGARKLDAAVVWGPIGAWYAAQHPGQYHVAPLPQRSQGIPLAFNISMAVRFGEPRWRARVERFLHDRHDAIQKILAEYQVPLLPVEEATQ